MATVFDVANFFLNKANETGSFISNLKLQKLVYYAQAWHLAINDRPVFEEDFQAWVHGPVVPALYRLYKRYSFHPIAEEPDTPFFYPETLEVLEEVAEEYMPEDAITLEMMTHIEDPWLETRGDLPPDANCERIIDKELIKRYFSSRLNG